MPKKKASRKAVTSYTDEDRRKIVEIWRKSGLTQRQFCKGLHLHPVTLSAWNSRIGNIQKDKVKKATFVPVLAKAPSVPETSRYSAVKPTSTSSLLCGSLRVQVASRFVVEVPETFSIPTLRDLIVTLEGI